MAVAARVSAPLRDSKGAEAALGIDWHPSAKLPLRLSVERRVAIGRDGRNAWAAYGAGGFWHRLKGGLETDGYAQAGVVGARRRDLFADGALRLGMPIALDEDHKLQLGGGAWGAAQPRASRLDIGPRVGLNLSVGGKLFSGSLDWRFRVAGNARPGSGPALTLAADF